MTRREHLLTILAEECAEVAQRVSKALRFGLSEVQPGQGFTNAERIGHELIDFAATVQMLGNEDLLKDAADFDERFAKKVSKVEQFLAYSKECGTLLEGTA